MEEAGESLHIYTIAEPTANTERSFDIIALHGIGGNWDDSWTRADGSCWLKDALPVKFPSSRILSLNYPSILQNLGTGKGEVDGVISHLLYDRETKRRSQRPIVFIGNSLGGNLVKQIFVATHPSRDSRQDHRDLHDSIRAYVFLGTPHKPVTHLEFDALWRALVHGSVGSIGGTPSELDKAFETTSRINHDFRRLGGELLPALCFYEGRSTRIGITESFIVPKELALYLSTPVSSGQLDLKHQDIGKLGGMTDSNLQHVASKLENLFRVIENPEFGSPLSDTSRTRGISILSLDGGGVKGLFSLIVLKTLLAEVQRIDGSSHTRKLPCEYFDLIGGTSTGGLLAIMLGRLQMDIPSCIRAYRKMSRDVFSRITDGIPWINPVRNFANAILGNAWFDGECLRAAICETIREQITDAEQSNLDAAGMSVEDLRLLSTEGQRTLCFVCAVCEGHHGAERIRSYLPRNARQRDTSSYTICQAGRATSAAPMYFPAIEIQGHYYFDGGLEANNPILEVVEEAWEQFPGIEIDALVSIGTGAGVVREPLFPILNMASALIDRLTTTEAQYERFMTEDRFEAVRPVCSRFQEMEGLGKVDLAASDKLDEIERLAQEYVRLPDVMEKIAACAVRMVRSRQT